MQGIFIFNLNCTAKVKKILFIPVSTCDVIQFRLSL